MKSLGGKAALAASCVAACAMAAFAGLHFGMPAAVKSKVRALDKKVREHAAAAGPSSYITGTAAAGRAIAAAPLTLKDSLGRQAAAVTGAQGKFSVAVDGLTAPFVLKVQDGAASYFSACVSAGNCNVHPLTDLVLRAYYRSAAGTTDLDTAFVSSFPSLGTPPGSAELSRLRLLVMNSLSPALARDGVAGSYDFFSAPFDADGTSFDRVLDETQIAANADFSTVTVRDLWTGVIVSTITPPAGDASAPAAPGAPQITALWQSSVTLSWTLSASTAAAGYVVLRDGAQAGSVQGGVFTDTGLQAGSHYTYKVRAFGWSGASSPDSDSAGVTTPASAPAYAAGRIYARLASVSYSTSSAGQVALSTLSAAQVYYGTAPYQAAASGPGGFYSLPVPEGFRTLYSSAAGYIPVGISSGFASGQAETLDVALYSTSAVTARPGFVKGIITYDALSELVHTLLPNGDALSTYQRIAARAGGGVTACVDPFFVTGASAAGVVMSTGSAVYSDWRMLNASEYSALIAQAHASGLEFMMFLGAYTDETVPEYNEEIYAPGARSAQFWDSWFSEYARLLTAYAEIAHAAGAEYISVGFDMGYATGGSKFPGGAADCLARWTAVVSAVRAAAPAAKLVYFGGVAPLGPYYEDDDYPAGFTDLFDYVGVSYQAVTSAPNPSINELKDSIQTLLARYAAGGANPVAKPLFVMERTPSVTGGAGFDTFIEPELDTSTMSLAYQTNFFQQADIYEATFQAINGTPTGSGRVMGVFSWGYSFADDFAGLGSYYSHKNHQKAATIRGKPAESVVKYWFDRF